MKPALKACVDESFVDLNSEFRNIYKSTQRAMLAHFPDELKAMVNHCTQAGEPNSEILSRYAAMIEEMAAEFRVCESEHRGRPCEAARAAIHQLIHPAIMGITCVVLGYELARGKDMPK